MRSLLLAIVLVAATVPRGAAVQTPTASALAAAIQKKYSSVQAMDARFTQERRHEFLPQVERSAGRLKILKPSHLWFQYDPPAPRYWVIDGKYIWDYDVVTKLATREDLPKDGQMPATLLFLAGRGNIATDFNVAIPPEQPAGEWHLELRPRQKNADFDVVTLMVRRSDYGLIGMRTVAEDATTTFRFSDVNERARLSPGDFVLKLPKDVHIDYR
jgi:outer membrane lipoprotein-sorting protein